MLESLKLFDNIEGGISNFDYYFQSFNSLMKAILRLDGQAKVRNSLKVTRAVCSTQEKCLGSYQRFHATLFGTPIPEDIDAVLLTKSLSEENRLFLTSYKDFLSIGFSFIFIYHILALNRILKKSGK